MIIRIPGQDKTIYQNNKSDILGNILTTFNVDLTSNRGVMKAGPRLLKVADTTMGGLSSLGTPVAFQYFNGAYWFAAGSKLFTATTFPSGTIALDSSVGTPSIDVSYSDIKAYKTTAQSQQILLAAVNSTSLYKLPASGVWATIGSFFNTAAAPHLMIKYAANRSVYALDYDRIQKLDDTETHTTPLTGINDPITNYFTCITSGSNRIFVGTLNQYGGKSSIYEWDGAASQFLRTYVIDAQAVLAGIVVSDIPFFVDSNGNILKYQLSQFTPVARFPIPYDKTLTGATATGNVGKFIHPNGIAISTRGTIIMLINSQFDDSTTSFDERCPSGLWEYDDSTKNLTHIGSLSYYNFTSGSISDYGQMRISRPGAILTTKLDSGSASNVGTMMIGADYFDTSGNIQSGMWVNDTTDTVQKVMSFVTPKIQTENIQDVWQNLFTKYKFLNSSDRVIWKYRTTEIDPLEISVTFTSTTTFTTTSDISSYAIGDEVEFTQGTGSGMTAHITKIDQTVAGATITRTVTLDETITGATGTAKARFQHWIKTGQMASTTLVYDKLSPMVSSTWIQLRATVYLTGKGQIEETILVSTSETPPI